MLLLLLSANVTRKPSPAAQTKPGLCPAACKLRRVHAQHACGLDSMVDHIDRCMQGRYEAAIEDYDRAIRC